MGAFVVESDAVKKIYWLTTSMAKETYLHNTQLYID